MNRPRNNHLTRRTYAIVLAGRRGGRLRQRASAKVVFEESGWRGLAVDSLVSSGCIVSGSTVGMVTMSANAA